MPKHLTIDDADDFVAATDVGSANGIASLGPDGKVVLDQLPTSVTGAVSSVDGLTGDVDLSGRYVAIDGIWLNVRSYGALGDGIADDTSALQSAVNVAVSSRKPLFIPPGTYTISSSISIPAGEGLTIQGSGWQSSIKLKANSDCFIFTMTGADTRMVMRDLELDGNCLEQGITGTSGGIDGFGAVACLFENLHFVGCRDDGLFLRGMTGGAFGHNNRIVGCLFDESMASLGPGRGIQMDSSDENQIEFCDFEFLGGSGGAGFSTAVAILDRAGTQFIDNCNFVGGATNNCKGVRIQDCSSTKISNCNFDGTAGDSIFIAGSQNVIVGNTIFSPGEVGTAGEASGIHTEWAATQNLIQANSIASSPTNGKTRSLIREESMGDSGNNSIVGNVLITKGTLAVAALDLNAPGTTARDNRGGGAVGDVSPELRTVAGAVSDASFAPYVPADGMLGLDTTNKRLYAKVGGTWSHAVLDATVSKGLVVADPTGAVTYVVYRAPRAGTVVGVFGYRDGGTGVTVNATKNGVDLLTTDLSLSTDVTWMAGADLQNTALVAGDTLSVAIRSVSGFPAQVALQIDIKE